MRNAPEQTRCETDTDKRGGQGRDWVDGCTSAVWFAGWRWPIRDMRLRPEGEPPVVPPRKWLLAKGWRRFGLIEFGETPAAGRPGAVSDAVPP